MRNAVVLAVAALVTCPALPAAAQSRTFDQTVKLRPGGTLRLTATLGSVRLTAWDRDEVRIHARIEASERLLMDADYAERAVDATKVDVSGEGDYVRIRSNYDAVPSRQSSFWGRGRTLPEIHYEISAPRRIDLTLDIDRSDSDIAGFNGRVSIVADRSELLVKDIAGDLRAEIDRGGRSRFQNVEGSFRLDGDRTDIEIAVAKLTSRGWLELDRGEATIRVAADQPLTVRTDIERRGRFKSELPLRTLGGTSHSPEGTINGGGPELTVIAHRARVELREQ